jgi:hypothetical protein
MKKQIIFLTFFTFLIGCKQQSNTKTVENFSHTKSDPVKSEKENAKNASQDILFPGSDTMNFNLKIETSEEHIKVLVNITSGDSLFASLSSADKKANIRINQIELPDSTFDGPFGRKLHYKILQKGIYNIIIAEDMMAGDRWKGKFILKVWVK